MKTYKVVLKNRHNCFDKQIVTVKANSKKEVEERIYNTHGDQMKFQIFYIPDTGKLKKYHVTASANVILAENIDKIVEAYNKDHARFLAIGDRNVSYVKVEIVD